MDYEERYKLIQYNFRNDIIYINKLTPELPHKYKTKRICTIIEDITGEEFLDWKLYLDIHINRKNGTEEKIKASPEEIKRYDELCNKICENFEPYNGCPNIIRYEGLYKLLENHNLIKYVKYENSKCIYVDKSVYLEDKNNQVKEHFSCICSECDCSKLFLMKHKKTNNVFAIGSTCIEKFNKSLYIDMNTENRLFDLGKCKICECKLYDGDYKGNKMNYNKKLFEPEEICIDCYKNKYLNQNILDFYKNIEDIFEIIKDFKNRDFKCMKCNVPLCFKSSKNLNINGDYKDKTYCIDCKTKKEKQEQEEKHKQYRLLIEKRIQEREIQRKQEEEEIEIQRKQYEEREQKQKIEREQLREILKEYPDPLPLCVKYDEKDKVKREIYICWDNEKKYWYINHNVIKNKEYFEKVKPYMRAYINFNIPKKIFNKFYAEYDFKKDNDKYYCSFENYNFLINERKRMKNGGIWY